jgi:hypothetical protein
MKALRHILGIVCLAALSHGCDYIDPPYVIEGPNGCTVTEPDFTPRDASARKRKVLIEDFTGHRCGNCPDAAAVLHDITEMYPGQVVGIGEHCIKPTEYTGTLPTDTNLNPQLKYTYNFVRPAASDIDDKFGISNGGLPRGMVNRRQVSGSRSLLYSTWQNNVATILTEPQQIDIQVKPYYDVNTNSLCAYVYVQFLAEMTGQFKVVAYLTENHFVNWQKHYSSNPQDIQNYEHNHVLRENLSSVWGTLLLDGTSAVNQEFVNGYSITFDPVMYNINNCNIVAFVYDDVTGEVIQAEEQKIIN